MRLKLFWCWLLAIIFSLTGCITHQKEISVKEPELKYPTGLAIPPKWENGATFFLPKAPKGLAALPESYDAPETLVKNQGQCGSCSHFASIAVYESVLKKKKGIDVDLSEQNVLNCAKYDNYKCQGSYYHGKHLVENGAPLDKDDPYVGKATTCKQLASAYEKPEGFAYVGTAKQKPTEEQLREALVTRGALWTVVYADSRWNKPGPILRTGGRGQSNHAVTIVGYKPDPQNAGKYLFHIKNSWGDTWNGDGHVWLPYGVSNLGESAAFLALAGGNDGGGGGDCNPAILSVPSTMAVIAGKEISFAVKPQDGFTYEWFDGAKSVGKSAQIFYAPTTSGVMKLVATNKCGSSEVSIKLQIVTSLL